MTFFFFTPKSDQGNKQTFRFLNNLLPRTAAHLDGQALIAKWLPLCIFFWYCSLKEPEWDTDTQ